MNIVEELIEKFGSQTALAKPLGLRQSNISYWRRVGSIPSRWHSKIIEAAGALGIQISASDFLSVSPVTEKNNEVIPQRKVDRTQRVLNEGELDIGGTKIKCAVLSNGKRVIFQRELIGLLTGNKKGGLFRYFESKNLQPFLPEKFKEFPIADAVLQFPHNYHVAQGFEATDLIEICDMYLRARLAGVLVPKQAHLAAQAEIITRAFAKIGIIAAIDEATGFQKERDEYQKLLSQYIAEDLQPWIETFGENYYLQIYRLRGWDWGRHVNKKRNHPWEVAKITNRIVYEKLPGGILEKLHELNPRSKNGHRKHKNFQFLTPNAGYVHLVKHLGHIEAIMEHHPEGQWHQALHEIDTRFPSLRDPYGQPRLPL